MNAVEILLADSVTSAINTAVGEEYFDPLTFTARRSYPDWDIDFEDVSDLSVDVVFVSNQSGSIGNIELASQDSVECSPAVDVCVRKRFAPSDREKNGRLKNASVDQYVSLVQQLHEKLVSIRDTPLEITSGLHANWIETKVLALVNQMYLRQGLFIGAVRVMFDVSKELP